MALVYPQEMSQGGIINYPQREQSASTNTADCTVQHLCYQSPLCNSVSSLIATRVYILLQGTDYLQAPNTLTTASHDLTSTDSSLLNYSINSSAVCPLYRPSLSDQGLGPDPLHSAPLQQPHSSDDVCYMMEQSNSDCSVGGPQPQHLNWQAFMVDKWYSMRDRAMQDM